MICLLLTHTEDKSHDAFWGLGVFVLIVLVALFINDLKRK